MLRPNTTLMVIVLMAVSLGDAIAADDRKATEAETTVLGSPTWAAKHKTIILNDPDAPLKIKAAKTFLLGSDQREAVKHTMLRYLRPLVPKGPIVEIDAINSNVVAAKFGVLFYDTFNEPAGRFTGLIIGTPEKGMRWSDREKLSWREFGIACVFVRAVRLKDGSVWKFDRKKIATMLVAEGCSSEGKAGAMKRLEELPKGRVRL